MSDSFDELTAEFHKMLTATRAANGTERITQFMEAYELFKAIHHEVGLSVPTVNGTTLTEERFREMVTKDDLGTEPDPEAFAQQATHMEEKIEMVEDMHHGEMHPEPDF